MSKYGLCLNRDISLAVMLSHLQISKTNMKKNCDKIMIFMNVI